MGIKVSDELTVFVLETIIVLTDETKQEGGVLDGSWVGVTDVVRYLENIISAGAVYAAIRNLIDDELLAVSVRRKAPQGITFPYRAVSPTEYGYDIFRD